MSEGNKKRKLEDEDDGPWSKAKAEAFVKEVEELQEAIKYCDAWDFTTNLSESLDEASTKTVQLVKELVTPILLDGYTDSRHCVRCHKSYTEKDNHTGACIIRCSGQRHPFTLAATPTVPYLMSECCGRVFKDVKNWKYTKLVCVEERHTTDPDEVIYFDPNRWQNMEDGKPKDAEHLGNNNPTVLPCVVKGCNKET
ncbi:hypothetical protein FRC12_020523 [Ceratobasidium sp. 428]|nr:hypothetical protein FRC12_020523 [Ceratobasidium sp. 428]